MADELAQFLSKPSYDADKFVKKVSDGGEGDLHTMQRRVQKLADETSVALKKNVYKNYSQFIETAKEISILESEMYQLSHMLTDQKSLIHGLHEMALIVEKAESADDAYHEEDRRQNLAFLLEKVEGCSSVLEVAGRSLVHSGDLLEVDPETFSHINKLHAFLLSDSLMFATWLPHRRGPVKYRFQGLCELDSLAVVNVRDAGGCKNAFKILMFPDTRMFQAESAKEKRMWLDILDETKRKKAALDSQRKEAAQQAARERQSAVAVIDPSNPFFEGAETPVEDPGVLEQDLLHVEWVQEVPEDLDVFIAQREFEQAVDLVEKIRDHLAVAGRGAAVKEYRSRIEQRIKQLTEVLMHELQTSPERSIRGGPRVARRAVTQLIRLGKSAQACTLFLENRSAIIRYNLRQLKIEGNTTLYVKRLCAVFFENIGDTAHEFIKAFPEHYGCFSGFVMWARGELENFVRVFCTQVFGNKTTLTTVADCVQEARQCCDKLAELGLELTFSLDQLLESEIRRVIQEAGDCQIEAVKHRAVEDTCEAVNFGSAELLEKFEEEMAERGLVDVHQYSYDTCTHLSRNTQSFARTYAQLCADLVALCADAHAHIVSAAFTEILTAQLRHQQKCLQLPQLQGQRTHTLKSAQFLVECVLPLVADKFTDRVGLDLPGTEAIEQLWADMQSSPAPV